MGRARGRRSGGPQCPATPDGGVGGRGDDADGDLPSLSEQCSQVPAHKKLTEGRKRGLEEAGAFRALTNARRSFEPQHGPARKIASIDSMVVEPQMELKLF